MKVEQNSKGAFVFVRDEPESDTQMVDCQPNSATKYDTDKNRLELLPFEALEEVGWVMTYGAKKYAAHNWRKGFTIPRVLGAALRHIFAYLRGETRDPESGHSHLAHACCMLLFAITFDLEVQNGKAE